MGSVSQKSLTSAETTPKPRHNSYEPRNHLTLFLRTSAKADPGAAAILVDEFDLTALGLGHACRAAAPKQRLKMIGPGREIGAFVVVVVAVDCCLFGLFYSLTLMEPRLRVKQHAT